MGIFDARKVSTQDHLDIADIRDDLVVLKSGKVSLILETTSLNFELLDPKEQDGKIGSFAAFLNAINFPIQIVIRTQRTDIARYQKLLEEFKAKTSTQKVVQQITSYQQFVNELTQTTQILDKRFFAIIPTIKLPVVQTNFIKQLLGKQEILENIPVIVRKAKDELYPKRDHLLKNFANMNIAARQLTTDELIKLYYSVYEPDKLGIEVLNLKAEDIGNSLVSSSQP
jgi:hypothetical protein